MTRVMIVEDQSMPRQLFEMIINESEGYSLVHSITNADMADFFCSQSKLDLIIMDVCTDLGASGLEAAARIKVKYPEIKIIIVTSMPEHSFLEKAKAAKVDSFWYKELSQDSIKNLMDRTMAGENIYPDHTPELHIGNASSNDFTPRELQVLRLLLDGYTDKEIAAKLGISANTAHEYVKGMLAKAGLRSRTSLAVETQKSGFILNGF